MDTDMAYFVGVANREVEDLLPGVIAGFGVGRDIDPSKYIQEDMTIEELRIAARQYAKDILNEISNVFIEHARKSETRENLRGE